MVPLKQSPPADLPLRVAVPAYAQQLGIPAPIAELEFHPRRKWRLDFAWPHAMVALEVHGAVHVGGRHTRGVGFERDREKMVAATAQGWRVLEVSTGQLWEPWLWAAVRRLMKTAGR